MKSFPNILQPCNKHKFKELFRERSKCYLRKELYEHILIHEEREYFSLDPFINNIGDRHLVKEIVSELMDEIRTLGWKCKTSFGGTGLFIYSTENPPSNCFEDM
jgi:hypothetical protein